MSLETVPRRRLKPEVRRAAIVDAATTLLARKGYWALTMADVAKDVGVTVQGVLHYFASKDELMLAVLDRRDRVDIETVTPSGHAVGDAQEFIEVVSRLVARNAERPELIRLYTVLSAESLDEAHPAHAFFDARFDRAVRTFAALGASWHADPPELGLQVLAVLDGLQLNWLRHPEIDLVAQWRALARGLLGLPAVG